MNIYYVKSEKYWGEDARAVLAETADEAMMKYRIQRKKEYDQWLKEKPEDPEELDVSVGSVTFEGKVYA